MKTWGVLLMVLCVMGCSPEEKSGYYKGYELPRYTTIEKEASIEIRQYQPYLVAEVSVEGTRGEAAKKGFRILANYIFGGNQSKTSIDMTSPVQQSPASETIAMTSPVMQQAASQQSWRIQFAMPKSYTLESLPRANDGRIQFYMSAPKTVAAIQFSGRWSDALFQQHYIKLKDYIAAHHLKALSEPVFAYYDDPFTFPWNRRNEIIVEVSE